MRIQTYLILAISSIVLVVSLLVGLIMIGQGLGGGRLSRAALTRDWSSQSCSVPC